MKARLAYRLLPAEPFVYRPTRGALVARPRDDFRCRLQLEARHRKGGTATVTCRQSMPCDVARDRGQAWVRAKVTPFTCGGFHLFTPDGGEEYQAMRRLRDVSEMQGLSGAFRCPVGLATRAGKRPLDFDPRQLRAGMRVEREHTPDRRLARCIAMDHLTEHPDYYRRLRRAGL